MQRAINHYIKKRSKNIDSAEHPGESFINQYFDLIDDEINLVKKVEIKKAREKKLREWRKKEKLNCRHNNKKEEFNLITIYGAEIKIITDLENVDAVYAEILDDLDANNLYYVGGNGEAAIFKGHELFVIDFKKIIGRD